MPGEYTVLDCGTGKLFAMNLQAGLYLQVGFSGIAAPFSVVCWQLVVSCSTFSSVRDVHIASM
jgi:hypothetical protein